MTGVVPSRAATGRFVLAEIWAYPEAVWLNPQGTELPQWTPDSQSFSSRSNGSHPNVSRLQWDLTCTMSNLEPLQHCSCQARSSRSQSRKAAECLLIFRKQCLLLRWSVLPWSDVGSQFLIPAQQQTRIALLVSRGTSCLAVPRTTTQHAWESI